MSSVGTVRKKLSQHDIYRMLQRNGSRWLKQHVLFADRQLVVLNKPPGIVTQLGYPARKSERERDHSMPLNPIFHDIGRWIRTADPRPIHRLDEATTGCLVIALNATSAKSLSTQFQEGNVSKTYLALVRGGEKSFRTKSGEIAASLAYNDGRGMISPSGREALTRWEWVASSTQIPLSLLRLKLITGNKHQLRIHLAKALRTPILGDTLYSQTSLHPSISAMTTVPVDRLFLHASEVSFYKYHEHGKRYRLGIRAPVPADFRRICRDAGLLIPLEERTAALSIDDNIVNEEETAIRLWNPRIMDTPSWDGSNISKDRSLSL